LGIAEVREIFQNTVLFFQLKWKVKKLNAQLFQTIFSVDAWENKTAFIFLSEIIFPFFEISE
jgi:hypothetical protein